MALSVTSIVPLTKSGDAHGTGAFTTVAFTPGAGVKLLVRLFAMSNSNDALAGSDLTITDSMGPLTWTSKKESTSADSPGYGYAGKIWLSSATSGAGSMTLTFDAGAFNVTNFLYAIDAVTGEDTTTPTGATAIGTDADGEGAASITLDAAPAATSVVLAMAMIAHDNTIGSIDAGGDFTEETPEVTRAGWLNTQLQRRTGSTSTTVAWTDLNNGGSTPLGALMMAVEIKQAGGGASILRQMMNYHGA